MGFCLPYAIRSIQWRSLIEIFSLAQIKSKWKSTLYKIYTFPYFSTMASKSLQKVKEFSKVLRRENKDEITEGMKIYKQNFKNY